MVNCRPPWARATLNASTQTVTPASSFLKPGEKKSPAAISDMCGLKVARCPVEAGAEPTDVLAVRLRPQQPGGLVVAPGRRIRDGERLAGELVKTLGADSTGSHGSCLSGSATHVTSTVRDVLGRNTTTSGIGCASHSPRLEPVLHDAGDRAAGGEDAGIWCLTKVLGS
jgi:hypothetical protein